jgi:hypothetical protein
VERALDEIWELSFFLAILWFSLTGSDFLLTNLSYWLRAVKDLALWVSFIPFYFEFFNNFCEP